MPCSSGFGEQTAMQDSDSDSRSDFDFETQNPHTQEDYLQCRIFTQEIRPSPCRRHLRGTILASL
jgi:hypothetical protein